MKKKYRTNVRYFFCAFCTALQFELLLECLVNGGVTVRTDWVSRQEYDHLLAALMPANRLALEIAESNGLRISDALSIKTAQLARRFTVCELKTGKTRRVYLSDELLLRAERQAGRVWCFEGRNDYRKHRTRQAVYKDLKRIAKMFRLRGGSRANIAPHTARKIFAVSAYHRTGSLDKVKALLNHDSEAVTLLYALADELTAKRLGLPSRSL